MEHRSLENDEGLMQYPTIFSGVLYSVSLDTKSVALQIRNQDPVPAPAPIFIL